MIHKYKQGDFNIVLDINSGAIHVMDDDAYDIFCVFAESPEKMNSLFAKYGEKQVKDILIEIIDLIDSKRLLSNDEIPEELKQQINSPFKAMCLNVSNACQLRCRYCFAAKNFNSKDKLMSDSIARKSIDYLVSESGNRKNLEVDFFGGEPLTNFEVIKNTIEYARSIEKKYNKNFRFTITTNGIALDDEKIDFINREIFSVILSLDGRRSVNDLMRVDVTGSGYYEDIVPKFQKIIKNRKNYYIRGTFTKENLDFCKDVLSIYELGFNNISIEPVVIDENFELSIKHSDLKKIFEEYEKLANKIIDLKKNGSNINFFHFKIDFENGPCIIKRIKGCGCGNEYFAVDPSGDAYPCHQFIGVKKFKLGNIDNPSSIQNKFHSKFKQEFSKPNIYSTKKCNECWAKFYCCGGCAANNWKFNNDIKEPYEIFCELEKKRVECAIMIKCALNSV
ncbi:MAG: thioether cross-link-forming SCIFF peptide maturase [Oscillospiraceae bacterium]|jgi:uncharacterized protein|nr:thioether cross-link-forming SCIFF peptide maturase [Oscillospiraceae bacterium]